MKSATAREVLALHRLSEADAEALLIVHNERRLSDRLPAATGSDGALRRDTELERWARSLSLNDRVRGALGSVLGQNRSAPWRRIAVGVIVFALLVGFLTNEIGSSRVLDLLSLPMLGLILWNLVIYIVCAYGAVQGARARKAPPGPNGGSMALPTDGRRSIRRFILSWLLRMAGAPADVQGPPSAGEDGGGNGLQGLHAVIGEARNAFWSRWLILLKREAVEWTELIFHFGAIALVSGIVGGMYVRGLATEYKAAWESTFLDGPTVARVVGITLKPAALILHERLPEVGRGPRGEPSIADLNIHAQEELEPGRREGAARWIHLYAVTALVFIGLPRLMLAGFARRRLRRLHEQVPFDADLQVLWDKLDRNTRGEALIVQILPFCHEIDPTRRATLRSLMEAAFGRGSSVGFLSPLAYGGEDDWLDGLAGGGSGGTVPGRLALVMSLSATPESEVHGWFIRELSRRIPILGNGGEETSFVVVLDALPFRDQFAGIPEFERRLRERRGAWEAIIDSSMQTAFSEQSHWLVWRRVGAK